MTTLREAAAMALDALEWCEPAGTVGYGGVARRSAAIAALREALAAPEPVAWRYKKEGGGWFVSDNEPQYVEQWNDIEEIQPLYAAPPAAPAPVVREPLTDEDVLNLWSPEPSRPVLGKNKVLSFARAIERAHGIGTTGGVNG